MADFTGKVSAGDDQFVRAGGGVEYTGRVADAHKNSRRLPGEDALVIVDPHEFADTLSPDGSRRTVSNQDFTGRLNDKVYPGSTWFESFHVIPRRFDFGNLLSEQTKAVEVYSAFRNTAHDWTSFVNNAGGGVTLLNQPALPETFQPQTGSTNLQLQVGVDGPPSVDSTLDFVFGTVPQTILVPITITRVILFVPEPELPYDEFLESNTEILPHPKDGTEQRISARKNVRQLFEWRMFLEDGDERALMHNLMFEWQTRLFGLPIWHDLTVLSSPAIATDTVLQVRSTDFADFRTGGLVVVYTDTAIFDVQPVLSFTSTSITLENPLANGYPAGTRVVPVRVAQVQGRPQGTRFPSADGTFRVRFRVTENDIDIADTSAFSSFNGKVLIDGCNNLSGALQESFDQEVIELDNLTGKVFVTSLLPANKRQHGLTLFTNSRQGLWEVRQLLHALRGRQTSFYVSSFSKDFTPNADLTIGQNTLTVNFVGYTRFAQSRQPRNVIRVLFNNGDPPLLRTILSSIEQTATTEVLTLDGTWPSTYTPSQVKRVEYVEKVRYTTDRIRLRHERGDRVVKITGPVRSVFG